MLRQSPEESKRLLVKIRLSQTAKRPAFLVRTAPTSFPLVAGKSRSLYTCVVQAAYCTYSAQSSLCEHTWPASPSYTSIRTCAAIGWACCMPCTCKGKSVSWLAQQGHCSKVNCLVGRKAKAHTSLTPDHIPHPSASWGPDFSKYLAQDKGVSVIDMLIILLHLMTFSSSKYKYTSLHFSSIVTVLQPHKPSH